MTQRHPGGPDDDVELMDSPVGGHAPLRDHSRQSVGDELGARLRKRVVVPARRKVSRVADCPLGTERESGVSLRASSDPSQKLSLMYRKHICIAASFSAEIDVGWLFIHSRSTLVMGC